MPQATFLGQIYMISLEKICQLNVHAHRAVSLKLILND